MLLRLPGPCVQMNPVRPQYKPLGFLQWVQRSTHPVATQDKPHTCKFFCLLKLPPTNLECSASFFGLFLPSVYGSNFRFNPRSSLGCKLTLSDLQVNTANPDWQSHELCHTHGISKKYFRDQSSKCHLVPHATVIAYCI